MTAPDQSVLVGQLTERLANAEFTARSHPQWASRLAAELLPLVVAYGDARAADVSRGGMT